MDPAVAEQPNVEQQGTPPPTSGNETQNAVKTAEDILKEAKNAQQATYTTDTGNTVGEVAKDMYVKTEMATRTGDGVGEDTSQTDPRFTEPMATLNAPGANPETTAAIATAVAASTSSPDYSPAPPQEIVDAPPAGTKLPEWTSFRPGEKVEGSTTPTLAEIKSLAEKMRNENNQIALANEAAENLKQAAAEAQNESDTKKKKRILGAALGTIALLAALIPRDQGEAQVDTNGMTDAQRVDVVTQMRNIGTEGTKTLDQFVVPPTDILNNPTNPVDVSKPIEGPMQTSTAQTGLTGEAKEPIAPASGNTPMENSSPAPQGFDNRQ